jgi:6-phosphogluconolactonase
LTAARRDVADNQHLSMLAARALYLHIEGEEKLETLERAEAEGPVEDMPVRAILRQTSAPLTIFWSP